MFKGDTYEYTYHRLIINRLKKKILTTDKQVSITIRCIINFIDTRIFRISPAYCQACPAASRKSVYSRETHVSWSFFQRDLSFRARGDINTRRRRRLRRRRRRVPRKAESAASDDSVLLSSSLLTCLRDFTNYIRCAYVWATFSRFPEKPEHFRWMHFRFRICIFR